MPDLDAIWEDIAPWLAAGGILYAIFAIAVLVLVITIFVKVFRSMKKMDKEHDDMRRRMFDGRGLR